MPGSRPGRPTSSEQVSGARRPFRPGCPKVVQPGFESELQLLIEDEPADGPTGRRRFDSRRGHDGPSDGSRRPVPWRTPPTGGKRGHAEHHEQQWGHQTPHEVRQRHRSEANGKLLADRDHGDIWGSTPPVHMAHGESRGLTGGGRPSAVGSPTHLTCGGLPIHRYRLPAREIHPG